MMIAELGDVEKFNPVEQPYGVEERVPDRWTPHHVGVRLVDAFKTLERTPRVPGPREPGAAWPSYQYDWADRLAQAEQTATERKDRERQQNNNVRIRPSAVELQQMDAAFDWLRQLREFDEGFAVQLVAWTVRSAKGKSVRDLCKERGWSFQNFYRRIGKGKSWISDRLNSTSSPVF